MFLTVGFPVVRQDEVTTCSIQGCWCRGEQHHRGFVVWGFFCRGEGKAGEGGWIVGGNDDSTAGCQSPLEMSHCLERCQIGEWTAEGQGKPDPLRGACGTWFLGV